MSNIDEMFFVQVQIQRAVKAIVVLSLSLKVTLLVSKRTERLSGFLL